MDFESLNERCLKEITTLQKLCKSTKEQLVSIDQKKRKESFIVRNFPESQYAESRNLNNLGKAISPTAESSNMYEAISSIAHALGLSGEVNNIHEAFRLGRPREDGKPRLIMVKAPERVCRLFLGKARLLKHAQAPFCNVFLQEDLTPEVNKKLIEMRRKAYEHRTKNPGQEAYVKNKKLQYISWHCR